MDRLEWRKRMDELDPSFWISRKQYLLSLGPDEMEIAEFLVWQAFEAGRRYATKTDE